MVAETSLIMPRGKKETIPRKRRRERPALETKAKDAAK